MYKFIMLIISMVFFAASAFSDERWASFRTNNSDTDYIRDIVTEGNTIWCATNGGIVKWDVTTGAYTVFNPGGIDKAMFSAARDWNGVTWFGSWQKMPAIGGGYRACVYTYKDSVWTSLTWKNNEFFEKYYDGVVNKILPDAMNKRLIFVVNWSRSTKSYCTMLSYDGEKWEELITYSNSSHFPTIPMVVDTINPWNIWGVGVNVYYYFFEKTDQGYTMSRSPQMDVDQIYVTSIAIDRNNNLWMTAADIFKFDRKDFIKFTLNDTGAIGQPSRVIIDKNGVKWFGAMESLIRYDDTSWTIYPYERKAEDDWITALAADEQGDIWMGRGGDIARGYGLYHFHPTPTVVKEASENTQSIRIIGNTPNPFNPSTSIAFTVAEPGSVELAVYAATGQRVRTLVSRIMSGGTHEVVWDGRDDSGRPVSSGVYITRLVSGLSSSARKLLLMK